MRTSICVLLVVGIVALIPAGCFTDKSVPAGGIAAIPARTDPGTPGVEYRVVVIGGVTYTASRSASAHWPGGVERWDLVAVPAKKEFQNLK